MSKNLSYLCRKRVITRVILFLRFIFMPSVSSSRPVVSHKKMFLLAGLCACLFVAVLASTFFFTRSALVAKEATRTVQTTPVVSGQTDLSKRVDDLQNQLSKLATELDVLKNTFAANGGSQRNYVTEQANRELVQEHLFKTTTKQVEGFVRVTPFSGAFPLDYIPVSNAIWKANTEREFEWSEGSPWMLRMTQPNDFGYSIRVQRGPTLQNNADGSVECATGTSEGLRAMASIFKGMYPDEDWSKPCDVIEVSAPLKGGSVTETDEKTHKQVLVVMRAYIFRPKKVRLYDTTSEGKQYLADQPLASVLIGREKNLYADPTLIEWSLIPPLRSRYDGYLSEKQFKKAQTDVNTMIKDMVKDAPLFSGSCGYGDCY